MAGTKPTILSLVVYCVNLFVKANYVTIHKALAPYRVHVRFNQSSEAVYQQYRIGSKNLATSIRAAGKLPKAGDFGSRYHREAKR